MHSKSGISSDFPLSRGQQALWFLGRLDAEGGVYQIAAAARVLPRLDLAALRRTLSRLVARHPLLGASFLAVDGEPRQAFDALPRFSLLQVDAFSQTTEELRAEVERVAYRPFDLSAGRLLRVAVLRGASEDVFLLVVPHVVADFWSLAVLVLELGLIYGQECGRDPIAALPALTTDYAAHVERERTWLVSPEAEREWRFWRRRLAGLTALDLPTDRPRPPRQTFRGRTLARRLGASTTRALKRLARERSTHLTTLLLALFKSWLSRLSGQSDFAVGTPVAGRRERRLARQVGYYVNPVAVRSQLDPEMGFVEVLEHVRARAEEAFAHQTFPFPLLAERLQGERRSDRSAIFQVQFVFQKARRGQALTAFALGVDGTSIELGGARFTALPLEDPGAPFDLNLRAAEVEDELVFSLQANRALFDHTTVARCLDQLLRLTERLAADVETEIMAVDLLSSAQRHQLALEWGQGAWMPRQDRTLHDWVFVQAERTPETVALVDGEARLSYAGLCSRARRLAGALRRRGLRDEDRVAISLERSQDLLVALLGSLAAGGVFAPVDPAWPAERRRWMVDDSAASLLLGVEAIDDLAPWHPRALMHEPGRLLPDVDSRQLAYLIYTSGSTGRPKGVAIEHRAASALLAWALDAFSDAEMRGVLAATSISFDLSIFELFAPLSRGGTVILAKDALSLPRLPARHEISLVNTVPSVMAALTSLGALPASVLAVNLAGEPLPARQVVELESWARVSNLYGPSEDTTYSTGERFSKPWQVIPPDRVTIGRLLPGGRALVVDRRLQPVVPGVPGELLLGGTGLARGYFARPSWTAERFVPDPSGQKSPFGERLYRTGDRVRYLPDGRLDLIGRLDRQIKLRGFRIELGEIEAVLGEHPDVEEAVVLLQSHDATGARLVAWMAPEVDVALVGDFLAERLPGHLVPAVLAARSALPRLPNGKIDRPALADAELDIVGAERRAPRGAFEELVAEAFARLLGREELSAEDDFFALGGHSLLATRLMARLGEAIEVELSPSEVFEAPTVARLARRLERTLGEQETTAGGISARTPLRAGPPASHGMPTFAERRLWFLRQLRSGRLAYNMPLALRFGGALDLAALAATLTEIERRHEVLRSVFPSGDEVRILASRRFPVPLVDLAALGSADAERELAHQLDSSAWQPFDLAGGPLWRAVAFAKRGSQVLLLNLHHIACDGASLVVLAREIEALYAAARKRRPNALPPLPIQMRDVARWQRQWFEAGGGGRDLAFWRGQLADVETAFELPCDRPRPGLAEAPGAGFKTLIEPALWEALRTPRVDSGATSFMLLLAAFQALLHRLTGRLDWVVGSPVAGRLHPQTEAMIGCFVNTLALRSRPRPDETFLAFLQRTRNQVLTAVAHQTLPFEVVVDELAPRREVSPFFSVLFAFQPERPDGLQLGDVEAEWLGLEPRSAKFELTVAPRVLADGAIEIAWEYRCDLFDRATIERLAESFRALLGQIRDDAEQPLDALLPLMPKAERQVRAEPKPEARRGSTTTVGLLAELMGRVLGRSVEPDDDFFAQGGHSLLATRLVKQVREACGVELPIETVFEASTPSALAFVVEEALREGTRERAQLIPLSDKARFREQGWPLASAQKRLWFLQQFDPELTAYHLQAALSLRGPLDGPQLDAALTELVRRHDALRTTFHLRRGQAADAGEPFQRIARPGEVATPLPLLDLRSLREPHEVALQMMREASEQVIDLRTGPLWQAKLFRLGAAEHVFSLLMHHIIGDGESLKLFLRELASLYRGETLPPPKAQPVDLALRQKGQAFDAELDFWREQLANLPPVLDLPSDRPRPAVQDFAGASLPMNLDGSLRTRLARIAAQTGTTLFMTVLTVFQMLLWRLSGRRDLAIGVPTAGRRELASDGLIGMFVQTLVLRREIDPKHSFEEGLRLLRAPTLAAFAHQDLPFETLVDALQPNRDASHAPLFQVMFAWQTLRPEELAFPGLDTRLVDLPETMSHFDLTLSLNDTGSLNNTGGGFQGSWQFATALFDATTVQRWQRHFTTLLHRLIEAPRRPIADLDLLDDSERHQLRIEWNQTFEPEPWSVRSLHTGIAECTSRMPDAVAVSIGARQLSRLELQRRARGLSGILQQRGLELEDRVGFLLPPSPEAVITFLAILEAGGAAVPLPPSSPSKRLAYVCDDARLVSLITVRERSAQLAEAGLIDRALWLDSSHRTEPFATRDVSSRNLAYVIYTSGSTGRPKGVGVAHREALGQIRNTLKRWRLGIADRVFECSPFHFDASIEGLFSSLMSGARLMLPQEERWSARTLKGALAQFGATTTNLATALWQMWIESEEDPSPGPELRLVETGGEAMLPATVRHWFGSSLASVVLINAYGPTEGVVGACARYLAPKDADFAQISIGRTMPSRSLYLIEPARLSSAAIGLAGELWIGGDLLARGYLGRPTLTAERFVPDPWTGAGGRCYRTGDLARYRADGQIEFLGRIDHQIQLRGYRIELGEIETALEGLDAVARAAVILRRAGSSIEQHLIAFLVAATGRELPAFSELRQALAESLPEYMLPSVAVPLDDLPLTPNGKIDRAALVRLELPDRSSKDPSDAPRNPIENALAEIWRQILGVQTIGIDDNFFEVGGHSLSVVKLQNALEQRFKRVVPVVELFRRTTIRAQADYLGEASKPKRDLSATRERAKQRQRQAQERRRRPEIQSRQPRTRQPRTRQRPENQRSTKQRSIPARQTQDSSKGTTEAPLAIRWARLPNRLNVAYHSKAELLQFFDDIFEKEIYLRHGLTLPPEACVFDVGANIGLFTLFVAHKSPGARLFSFEPAPPLQPILRSNAANCRAFVEVFPFALGAAPGERDLVFYPESSGLSSLHADLDEERALLRHLIRQRQRSDSAGLAEHEEALLEQRLKSQTWTVPVRTVSAMMREHGIERIDLLKIDVEKSEADVLEGIEEADWTRVDQIVIEVHDQDGRLAALTEVLEGRDFRVVCEQDALYQGSDHHQLYARRQGQVEARPRSRSQARSARRERALARGRAMGKRRGR